MLKVNDNLPKSDVNREYYLQQVDRQLADTDGTVSALGGGKISQQKHEMLQRLARTTPYYKRNAPHICSFWVKGECKRGEVSLLCLLFSSLLIYTLVSEFSFVVSAFWHASILQMLKLVEKSVFC